MKKTVLSLVLSTFLAGCASIKPEPMVESFPPAVVYKQLEELPFQTLQIYDEPVQVDVDLVRADILQVGENESRVLAWKVPAYGAYRFTLRSHVERSNFARKAALFMANVRLLDKDFVEIKTLPASELRYQKPTIMESEFAAHDFVVDNRDPMVTPVEYIVVTMTDAGRKHTIQVVDQEKEYAKARGFMPPPTPDIFATAAETGSISLTGVALNSSYAKVPTSRAINPAYTPSAMPSKAVVATEFDTVGESKIYLDTMREYVSKGNISTALQMRQEVRQLHDNLQQQFVFLYGKPAESIQVVAEIPADITAEKRLAHIYQQQMNASFREGNTQAALALIDQLEILVMHAGDVLGS